MRLGMGVALRARWFFGNLIRFGRGVRFQRESAKTPRFAEDGLASEQESAEVGGKTNSWAPWAGGRFRLASYSRAWTTPVGRTGGPLGRGEVEV